MQWLKKFFHTKKTMQEVSTWLAEERKKHQEQQEQAIHAAQQAFPELIVSARRALVALENAELRNPNIPERAKHYMTGNREQFLKLTARFIENLFVPKEGPDFSQLDLLFHQYAQNTSRPAVILSEFFGEEVKNVRSSLSEIEKIIHDIKTLQSANEHLEEIADIIKRIHNTKTERETLEKQREDFEAQLHQLTNKREILKKEKEAFTTKPDYLAVKEDLLGTAKERQEAEQDITGLFLPLSDPIKKYAHTIKNDKLAKYAENPVEALIKDYTLGILKHITPLIDAIMRNELDLKPEKTQKALEALKQMNKERLSAMIHRYAKAKKREADIHHDVAQRPIMKEYEQYAVELKNANTEIEQLQQTIAKITLPTDEQLIEDLKKALEQHKIMLIQGQ